MIARTPIKMIPRSVAYARSVSATPPPPSSEPETTPEEFRQRALLFADLGRYDDAADEIAAGLEAAPADPALRRPWGRPRRTRPCWPRSLASPWRRTSRPRHWSQPIGPSRPHPAPSTPSW